MDIGKFHVLLVHFPIALVLAAGTADLLWLITRRTVFRSAGAYCLAAALLSAPVTVWTGWEHLEETRWSGPYADIAEDHEDAGFVTLGLVVGAAGARLAWHRWPGRWLAVVYGVLIMAAVASVSWTGSLGGELTHGQDYLSGAL